jgi:hypothetical protein
MVGGHLLLQPKVVAHKRFTLRPVMPRLRPSAWQDEERAFFGWVVIVEVWAFINRR